jgi:hypothetical protein
MKLTYTRDVDNTEVWRVVFGSGFETWGWWHYADYDWQNPAVPATLSIDDPDNDDRTLFISVTIDKLEAAINAGIAKYPHLQLWDYESYDSNMADVVLQIVAFGDVVYG